MSWCQIGFRGVRCPHDRDRPGRDGGGRRDQFAGRFGHVDHFPDAGDPRLPTRDGDDVECDRPGCRRGGLGGTWGGYRKELGGQWNRLRWQIPASLIGGAAIGGAFLLLHLPEKKVFTQIVPVLLILALVLVVIGPRIQAYARSRAEAAGGRSAEHVSPKRMVALVAGTFAVGIYGGYFTAAQGILLIGVMGALLPEDMQRMNAAKKNLLSLLVNIVAAVGYTVVAFDRVSWEAAGLIAVGSLVGGWLGAHYGRRLSPNVLRAVIVVVGLIGLYRLLTV